MALNAAASAQAAAGSHILKDELERWYYEMKEPGGTAIVPARYASKMAEEYRMSPDEADRSFQCWSLSKVKSSDEFVETVMRIRVEARRKHAIGPRPRDNETVRKSGALGCLSDKLPYLCCSVCTLGLSWMCWWKSTRDDRIVRQQEDEEYDRKLANNVHRISQAERCMLIEGIGAIDHAQSEVKSLEVETRA